jgi:hypothetical protein
MDLLVCRTYGEYRVCASTLPVSDRTRCGLVLAAELTPPAPAHPAVTCPAAPTRLPRRPGSRHAARAAGRGAAGDPTGQVHPWVPGSGMTPYPAER